MYIIIGYIFAKTHNCYVQCTVLIQKKLISTSKPPLLHHVIITWIRMTINLISYFVHTDCEPPKIMIHSMITWFLRILVKSRSLHSSSYHEIIRQGLTEINCIIKWGASSRWLSSLYCPMRISGQWPSGRRIPLYFDLSSCHGSANNHLMFFGRIFQICRRGKISWENYGINSLSKNHNNLNQK